MRAHLPFRPMLLACVANVLSHSIWASLCCVCSDALKKVARSSPLRQWTHPRAFNYPLSTRNDNTLASADVFSPSHKVFRHGMPLLQLCNYFLFFSLSFYFMMKWQLLYRPLYYRSTKKADIRKQRVCVHCRNGETLSTIFSRALLLSRLVRGSSYWTWQSKHTSFLENALLILAWFAHCSPHK